VFNKTFNENSFKSKPKFIRDLATLLLGVGVGKPLTSRI
jgi:hypothetical protein